MTLPAGQDNAVTVHSGPAQSIGNIPSGALIVNTDTLYAVFIGSNPVTDPGNGVRIGPLGSLVWSNLSAAYVALDPVATRSVALTVSTSASTVSNPLDVADAIHRDGITISGPVSITGTVPVSGDVNISSPVSIAGTVPVSGDVNATVSGTLNVATAAGVALDVSGSTVNVGGSVAVTGPVAISGTVPISGDVGINAPVTINGTVDVAVPGTVEVVAPTGTPLEVSVPGTVNIATAGALTVQTTPGSPLNVSGSTVNVNPVTISGTVPVSGTVNLGSGAVVGISGGVTISGPVSVSGGVTVNNAITAIQPYTLLHESVVGPSNTVDTGILDITNYRSLLVSMYTDSLNDPDYWPQCTILSYISNNVIGQSFNVRPSWISNSVPVNVIIPVTGFQINYNNSSQGAPFTTFVDIYGSNQAVDRPMDLTAQFNTFGGSGTVTNQHVEFTTFPFPVVTTRVLPLITSTIQYTDPTTLTLYDKVFGSYYSKGVSGGIINGKYAYLFNVADRNPKISSTYIMTDASPITTGTYTINLIPQIQ